MCIHRLHILVVLAFIIIYLLLPTDLLPEAALGIMGLFDDLLIIIGALVYITLIYRAHVTNAATL